jgi:hypothetical protein
LKKCIEEAAEMSRLRVISELWQLMKYNKKYWLAPIVSVLVLVGVLLIVAGLRAGAVHLHPILNGAAKLWLTY